MVNKFRGIFENLSKDSDFIRFGKLGIQKDVLGGSIIEVIPSPELVETSILLAEEKSLKTMDSNQNLIVRNRAEKINQSCRGILGEAAIQLLFAKQLKLPLTDIKRFDLERDSFDYTSDEYDLRISNIRIEVRTSNNPTASILDYISNRDRGVICTYTNRVKSREQESDFYFGFVYDYPGMRGPVPLDRKISFARDIVEGRLKMYLVAGVNNAERERYGVVTHLNQSNTSYKVVPFWRCRNIFNVIDELGETI